MPDYVVAVDVGGTLTKIAYAHADGSTSAPTRHETQRVDGQASVPWLAELITTASHARTGGRGFAVVVPGIIDVTTGVVRAAPNVGWSDLALRDQLSTLTGLPGALGHDVRAGGLAEYRLGAGAGAANVLFVALGTGIAAAIVADGRLVDADGYAGELGHIAVAAADAQRCPCGQTGCLETVASAAGVARTYETLTGRALDAQVVATRARADDPYARTAYDRATAALTEALTTAVTLLGPEIIVLGGGLVGALDLITPPLAAGLAARFTFQRRPRLVPAQLGADAGVIGAGLLGWDRIRRDRIR